MLRDRYARRRLVTFVVLVGMCLALLVASNSAPVQELRRGVNFAISPLQETLSQGTRSVTSVLGAFSEVDTLRRENQELQASVAKLQDQVATLEAFREENKQLNKLLKTRTKTDHQTVAAGVNGRYATPYERMVALDRGTEAGIDIGAPVITEGEALVGRVTDAGEGWAEVMLITDTRSRVAGLDGRTHATGLVTGRLSAPLAMSEIVRTDKVSVNDRIVTLGADLGRRFRSAYPKGLPIGRVVDIQEDPGSIVKTALVQPDADLEHLEYVLVVTDHRPPKRKSDEPPPDQISE